MKKSKKKKSNVSLHFSITRILIFLIVTAIVVGFGFGFKTPLENLINGKTANDFDFSVIDYEGLSVHFVDVGQGDSTAIRFPDGKTMLVDAGTENSRQSLVNYLKNKFFEKDEDTFDYVLLTHSDADHCGGMPDICENFVIDVIYRPKICCVYGDINEADSNTNCATCTSLIYYKTISAFNEEVSSSGENAKIVMTDKETANSSERIFGDDYSIDFFTPRAIATNSNMEINDFSPIMVLNYKDKKIMLTGDATSKSETKAINTDELPDVDILKVGHHGSSTSTSQKFLDKIKPEIAVISVGRNNSYKHPTTAVLNRLELACKKICRTDENGTVIANITSQDATINMYFLGKPNDIKLEYIIAGIVLLTATLCFGKKIKI